MRIEEVPQQPDLTCKSALSSGSVPCPNEILAGTLVYRPENPFFSVKSLIQGQETVGCLVPWRDNNLNLNPSKSREMSD